MDLLYRTVPRLQIGRDRGSQVHSFAHAASVTPDLVLSPSRPPPCTFPRAWDGG